MFRQIGFSCLIWLLTLHASGQSSVDSLKAVLAKASDDTAKIITYLSLYDEVM